MSMGNDKNMITNGNEKSEFVIQRPDDPHLMIPYLNSIVNKNIRNLFSEEIYEKLQKDPLFTKIVFALDDSIQRYNETYDYLKEFSKSIKEILNTESILEEVGFGRINKEFITKLYHNYLRKYKDNGLQTITLQEKKGANAIDLNGDMTRFFKDEPMTDYTKSLILTIVIHAIMIDECNQKEKNNAVEKYELE